MFPDILKFCTPLLEMGMAALNIAPLVDIEKIHISPALVPTYRYSPDSSTSAFEY